MSGIDIFVMIYVVTSSQITSQGILEIANVNSMKVRITIG